MPGLCFCAFLFSVLLRSNDLQNYPELVREIASETSATPGTMMTDIMSVLGLDYGDAEDLDKVWAKFYHDDLMLKLEQQARLITHLEDRIDTYERNFESPLT